MLPENTKKYATRTFSICMLPKHIYVYGIACCHDRIRFYRVEACQYALEGRKLLRKVTVPEPCPWISTQWSPCGSPRIVLKHHLHIQYSYLCISICICIVRHPRFPRVCRESSLCGSCCALGIRLSILRRRLTRVAQSDLLEIRIRNPYNKSVQEIRNPYIGFFTNIPLF